MSEVDKYSELKLVAGKATPGPWWVDSHGMNMTSLPNLDLVFSHPANGEAVRNAETGNLSHWRNDWDASYIATANPKTILGLIDDFDAQRLRADTAEAERDTERKFRESAEGGWREANRVIAMQRQRLDADEQRIAELQAAGNEMLRIAAIANQGSNAYNRAIVNLHAALNPNPEAESHGK